MGAAGSTSSQNEAGNNIVFINPGEPEIFNVSLFASTKDIQIEQFNLTDKSAQKYLNSVYIDLFSLYPSLTTANSKNQLFQNIILPSILKVLISNNSGNSFIHHIFRFENQRNNYFKEKFINLLSNLRNDSPVSDSFTANELYVFQLLVSPEQIESITEATLPKFIQTVGGREISLHASTLKGNQQLSTKLMNIASKTKIPDTLNFVFQWAILTGDINLMIFVSITSQQLNTGTFVPCIGFKNPPIYSIFSLSQNNMIGKFVVDEFDPPSKKQYGNIISFQWKYFFILKKRIISVIDMSENITVRQARFFDIPVQKIFVENQTEIATINNSLLLITNSNVQKLNVFPLGNTFEKISYHSSKFQITKPFTSDGTFIYSYKSGKINIFALRENSIVLDSTITLQKSEQPLKAPFNKDLLPIALTSGVMFCDGIVIHFIFFEKIVNDRFQHFVRSFSIFDGSHIGDSSFLYDYQIQSLSYDAFTKKIHIMTRLSSSAGITQYKYDGPSSPSLTNLLPWSIPITKELQKNFMKLIPQKISNLFWLGPFFIGSFVIPLVGLDSQILASTFPFYYQLFSTPDISNVVLSLISNYMVELVDHKKNFDEEKLFTCIKILYSVISINIEIVKNEKQESFMDTLALTTKIASEFNEMRQFLVTFLVNNFDNLFRSNEEYISPVFSIFMNKLSDSQLSMIIEKLPQSKLFPFIILPHHFKLFFIPIIESIAKSTMKMAGFEFEFVIEYITSVFRELASYYMNLYPVSHFIINISNDIINLMFDLITNNDSLLIVDKNPPLNALIERFLLMLTPCCENVIFAKQIIDQIVTVISKLADKHTKCAGIVTNVEVKDPFFLLFNKVFITFIQCISTLSNTTSLQLDSKAKIYKLLLNKTEKTEEKYDEQLILETVHKIVPNPMNKFIKGAEKEFEGKMIIAISQSFNQFSNILSNFPMFDPRLKPIVQHVYKIRNNLKESKQLTAAYDPSKNEPMTIKHQYPKYFAIIESKVNYLFENPISIEYTDENIEQIVDFVSNETPLEEYTKIGKEIEESHDYLKLITDSIKKIMNMENFPNAFLMCFCSYFASNTKFMAIAESLSKYSLLNEEAIRMIHQTISFFISTIPILSPNSIIPLVINMILTIHEDSSEDKLWGHLLSLLTKVIVNSRHIKDDELSAAVLIVFQTIQNFIELNLISIDVDKKKIVSGLMQNIPSTIAFDMTLATSLVMAGFDPPIDKEDALAMFYCPNTDFHTLLQYLYAVVIKSNENNMTFSKLLSFVGKVFCGAKSDILPGWIPQDQVSFSHMSKYCKTPEILIGIANEVLVMLRKVLCSKTPAEKEFVSYITSHIIDKIKSRESTIEESVAIFALLSNSITARYTNTILNNPADNQHYLVLSIEEDRDLIECISLPISGEIVIKRLPNLQSYSFEPILPFDFSLFPHFLLLLGCFTQVMNMPQSYSDSVFSFFAMSSLQAFISNPDIGSDLTSQLASTFAIKNFSSFEFRRFSPKVKYLLSLALSRESNGVFTNSPREPHLEHASFSKYISNVDYSLDNHTIKTDRGMHVFMSTVLDATVPSYFSVEIQNDTNVIFGLVMHSIDLNQETCILYSSVAKQFFLNMEPFLLDKTDKPRLIEFKFDPKRKKVGIASSIVSKRIGKLFLTDARCSFFAIVPPAMNIRYNLCLTPQTPNMQKTELGLKHLRSASGVFGRLKNRIFGIPSNDNLDSEEQKFSLIKSGVTNESTKGNGFYALTSAYNNAILNSQTPNLILSSCIKFSDVKLPTTNSYLKMKIPSYFYSMKSLSILSSPVAMSKFIQIDPISGFISSIKDEYAEIIAYNGCPPIHFENMEQMPNDVINTYIGGVCEAYKHEITTLIMTKLLSSGFVQQVWTNFSFTPELVIEYVTNLLVMCEPFKMTNFDQNKSPIDFTLSVFDSNFNCPNELYDIHTALINTFEVINNEKGISKYINAWFNKIMREFSQPQSHFVHQNNPYAAYSSLAVKNIIDTNAAGWIVFVPEFGKFKAPIVKDAVFPRSINVDFINYSFVPGDRLQYETKKCAHFPILQNSNVTLLNTFFALAINIKYFVNFVSLNKQALLEWKQKNFSKLMSEIYMAILGCSPFFYSHCQEFLGFLSTKLQINAGDISDEYMNVLNHVIPLSKCVMHFFEEFLESHFELKREQALLQLSGYLPSWCALKGEPIKNDPDGLSFPPSLLENNSFKRKEFELIQRIFKKYSTLTDYPFYLLLTDWLYSFIRYPPSTFDIMSPSLIKVTLTSNYIPAKVMLGLSAPDAVKNPFRISTQSDMTGYTKSTVSSEFTPPSTTFFIEFHEKDVISDMKFSLFVKKFTTKEAKSIFLNNREKFESDITSMYKTFTINEDQALLAQFPIIKVKNPNSVDLAMSGFALFEANVEREMHLCELRARFLLAFNWYTFHHPEVTQDSSFIPYARFISVVILSRRFRELIEKSNTGSRDNVTINRQIGLNVRSGVSKNLKDSMIAQFARAYSSPYMFRCATDPFHVTFSGENGIDCGGLSRDLASELAKDISDPNIGLFLPTPNARTHRGSFRESLVPAPSPLWTSTHHLYESVGGLIAISVRSGMVQPFSFPPLFWSCLMSGEIYIEQIYEIDVEYMEFIQNLEKAAQEKSPEEFQQMHYQSKIRNIRGEEVSVGGLFLRGLTHATVGRFIASAHQYRIQELLGPMLSIRSGFWRALELVPPTFVTPQLLEFLACGDRTISISKLRQLTRFDGMPSKMIDMFWTVLSRFTENQKRKFLQFSTGTTQIPANAVYPFLIVDFNRYASVDSVLPTASTCFYKLHVPQYSSIDIFYQKLLQAVEYTGTFENS